MVHTLAAQKHYPYCPDTPIAPIHNHIALVYIQTDLIQSYSFTMIHTGTITAKMQTFIALLIHTLCGL